MAGDTLLVNFQNDEATTPTRYLRDIGEPFGDQGAGVSYGWTSDHTDQGRERSVLADQRLDTLIHFEAGQSWELAVADGLYEVTVSLGDPANDDGIHTINVEGVALVNAVADGPEPLVLTTTVPVADGRLTIDQGAGAEKATRINYAHIVGVAALGNAAPSQPTITEPAVEGQLVNPADVHMEMIGYADADGDAHQSSDWEIWTTGATPQLVWQTLGIEGVEKVHTHQGDGFFQGALAGQSEFAGETVYQLRARFRDAAGSVSGYATRTFETTAASIISPMQLRDLAATPELSWTTTAGSPIDLPAGQAILTPNDAVIAIDLDSISGSDSPGGEQVANAIDGDSATKYLNFGTTQTGLIVTPGSSVAVQSLRLTTANDAEERDPASWVLYGTNEAILSSPHSTGLVESWTQVASGNLSLPAARGATGNAIGFANSTSYSSYKLVFPTVKNSLLANSMQVAEVAFFSSIDGSGGNVLSVGDAILPIRDVQPQPSSESPPGEGPAAAIDLGNDTKYLNFGGARSGLIITPIVGSSEVGSLQLVTANDFPDRDPASWELHGTNDPIVTPNNGFGTAESWTLIDSGSTNLPLDREAEGPVIVVNNSAGEFTSYRVVFPTLRGATDSLQFAELRLLASDEGMPSTAASLRIESGATGEALATLVGVESAGNASIDEGPLDDHADIRLVIQAGSQALSLDPSEVAFEGDGQPRTVYLPAFSLAAGESLGLWVDVSGATYYAVAGQTAPDFSNLAREAASEIPFVATKPGFVIEEVGSDYRLPVKIAFVPDPGPESDDPLYYVTELYGSIQVVTRDGTKHEFATGLLDYNPEGPISGSGEQGLAGIAVQRDPTDPEVYQLYVGMLADNGSPPGNASHYPKVERLTSTTGGLALDTRSVLLNMQPETQGQSHQISDISIGPDNKLYVHNGDGFDATTALDLDQFRGKVLRMELDGSAPTDNPFYDAQDGVNARDYVYAYGFRNPFGGAWRASDGSLYEVENGPSVDRFARVDRGASYGWDGSNASMQIGAIYNWAPSTAPVNLAFIQQETFAGSQFPAGMQDHAFVTESGPTYATGAQANGKRITEFTLDANGTLTAGPDSLIEYVGRGKSSVGALAAGPDGLYFSELYEDSGDQGPTGAGARLYRIRYENPIVGDYNLDGQIDDLDRNTWQASYGSNLLLAADGNQDGIVNAADYTVWRDSANAAQGADSLVIHGHETHGVQATHEAHASTAMTGEPSQQDEGEARPSIGGTWWPAAFAPYTAEIDSPIATHPDPDPEPLRHFAHDQAILLLTPSSSQAPAKEPDNSASRNPLTYAEPADHADSQQEATALQRALSVL